ncbi:hypothetical protein COLO4_03748 [Corchorus olitorius]|uniref:Uncharacterized protein n=1 Tax=Corchorus olitorius TaxID=93759 RepID=A0A1R3KWW3_9ROSI|nr:hypothetical protein COLO4_03748 [Corchorus olitorius]
MRSSGNWEKKRSKIIDVHGDLSSLGVGTFPHTTIKLENKALLLIPHSQKSQYPEEGNTLDFS